MKMGLCTWALLLGLRLSASEVCQPSDYRDYDDSLSDKEQFYLPEMKTKPKMYRTCTGVISIGNRNSIAETKATEGLQYHLLCQSLAGLANRAVEEGRSETAIWLHDHGGKDSYRLAKQALGDMGIYEQDVQDGISLACDIYAPQSNRQLQPENLINGGAPKNLISGYVLTDVRKNPESNIVASVASHVYNSIIVDVRDQARFEQAGFILTYDATRKTTLDAWHEFKDRCSNDALVIMPVQTGELREFAIKNNLFVLNLNKEHGTPKAGQNTLLLEEVLAWLKPNAPVYGWEQGVSEDQFVARVSKSGHPMIPCDWSYNHSLTSLLSSERPHPAVARAIDPARIDYKKKRNYVSFFLSDGDNIQWMMQDFASRYYDVPAAFGVKMSYGLPVSTLTMMAPDQLNHLLQLQHPQCSVLEMLGGGYYYIDTYSCNSNRTYNLKVAARRLATHMRRHKVSLLAVMAMDVNSAATREACQAYADANDRLEGIILLQYSPYAGGAGQVFWVTNRAGYDIPVITTRYTLWDRIHEREGSPSFIAGQLKDGAEDESFSAVCVHAWSRFEGGACGADAARQCAEALDERFEVVNMQELVWRLRMNRRPEQTLRYLQIK